MLPRFFVSLAKPATIKPFTPSSAHTVIRNVFVARRAFSSFRTLRAEDRPAGRPKGHTGRLPARPRTRKTPAVAEDGTEVAVTAPKKRSTTAEPKAAKVRKPKAKKVAKPKKVVKKKKVLTEEQKLAAAEKQKRADLRALRLAALDLPTLLPSSVYRILFHRHSTKGAVRGSNATAAAAALKALSDTELQELQRVAVENSAKNVAAKQAFIEALTPLQVRDANTARARLRRLGHKNYPPLRDPRINKPVNAYATFVTERFASGDMAGTPVSEAGKLIAQEWKALGDSGKQRYIDEYLARRDNYERELKQLYGQDMLKAGGSRPAAAAASA